MYFFVQTPSPKASKHCSSYSPQAPSVTNSHVSRTPSGAPPWIRRTMPISSKPISSSNSLSSTTTRDLICHKMLSTPHQPRMSSTKPLISRSSTKQLPPLSTLSQSSSQRLLPTVLPSSSYSLSSASTLISPNASSPADPLQLSTQPKATSNDLYCNALKILSLKLSSLSNSHTSLHQMISESLFFQYI